MKSVSLIQLPPKPATSASSGDPGVFKGKPTLLDFQGFSNPRGGDISRAVWSTGRSTDPEDYFSLFREMIDEHPETREYLSQKLRGEVVVDLGCGDENIPHAAGLMERMGASLYIGVDRDPRDVFHTAEDYGLQRIALLLKDSDGLAFVSRLPSESMNFMINGIDQFIFRLMGGGREYQELLFSEIARATKKDGIVFGRGSEPIEDDFRENPERSKLFIDRKGLVTHFACPKDCFLFEKI